MKQAKELSELQSDDLLKLKDEKGEIIYRKDSFR